MSNRSDAVKLPTGPAQADSALALCSYNAPRSHSYGPGGEIIINDHLSISVGQVMHGLLCKVLESASFRHPFWVALGTGEADFDGRVCDEQERLKISSAKGAYTLQLTQTLTGSYASFKTFCNDVLSPLFHMDEQVSRIHSSFVNLQALPSWKGFCEVNEALAENVIACLSEHREKTLQVHDFECCLVTALVRRRLPEIKASYFGHIAWPSADFFKLLPDSAMRREILAGVLANDKIFFHTRRFADNFIACVAGELPASDLTVEPPYVTYRGRRSKISVNPLGVDNEKIAALAAATKDTAWLNNFKRDPGALLCVWAERSDFTKGTLERLHAIRHCFNTHPEIIERINFVQVLAPSRQYLQSYKALYQKIIEATELINRDFPCNAGKVQTLGPLHWEALMSLFSSADIMWVNSLNDGLALTAKEYVATHFAARPPGVLMLSRFAGAAAELKEALLLNPFDFADTAAQLYRAVTMPAEERAARVQALCRSIKHNNFGHSVNALLK